MENISNKNTHEKITKVEIENLFGGLKDAYEDLQKANDYLTGIRASNRNAQFGGFKHEDHDVIPSIEDEINQFNDVAEKIHLINESTSLEVLRQNLEYLTKKFTSQSKETWRQGQLENPEIGGM